MGFQPVENMKGKVAGAHGPAKRNRIVLRKAGRGYHIHMSADVSADSGINGSVAIAAGGGPDTGYIRLTADGPFKTWKASKEAALVALTVPTNIRSAFNLPPKSEPLRFIVNPDKSITIDLRQYLKPAAVAA